MLFFQAAKLTADFREYKRRQVSGLLGLYASKLHALESELLKIRQKLFARKDVENSYQEALRLEREVKTEAKNKPPDYIMDSIDLNRAQHSENQAGTLPSHSFGPLKARRQEITLVCRQVCGQSFVHMPN